MKRLFFAVCAYAAIAGMCSALVSLSQLLVGEESLTRLLAWPWFVAIFPVWTAALLEGTATAKRIGYRTRFFPRPREIAALLKAVAVGCPRWVGVLSGASAAASFYLARGRHAELTDGLTTAELPVVVAVSLGFFAASAPVLWSASGRQRWAAAA